MDYGALNRFILEILLELKEKDTSGSAAFDRHLFATAITPEGIKSLIDSALSAEKTYVLRGFGAMGITELLKATQKYANLLGISTVSFKNPLTPAETEHLIIPERNIAFVTANNYHEFNPENAANTDINNINFGDFTNALKFKTHKSEIEYNNEIFDELLKKSISTMSESKTAHDSMEAVYSEAMDFKKMHRAYDKVLEEICGDSLLDFFIADDV